MIGLWAAGKRGETGTIAENYARALIQAGISAVPNAAFNKLVFDLAGYRVDAAQIRQRRDELLAIAQRTSA
jgi:hypothetical protein